MKIRFEDLTKVFRDGPKELIVINQLNLDFDQPETIAIVGKSGIGKSTLLHLLAGIERPSSGNIFVDDLNLSVLNENQLADYRLAQVGLVFQFHHLLGEFTALENVSLPLLIKGFSETDADKQALEYLDLVGLKERVGHRPGELSGGEQQRVAIARALVHKPRMLLADEPTGSLDFETSEQIGDLILKISKEQNICLITVTHSLEFAKKFKTVYQMEAGGRLTYEN